MISSIDFFTQAPIPILLIIEEKVIDCNRAALKLLPGISKREILKRHIGEIVEFTDFGNENSQLSTVGHTTTSATASAPILSRLKIGEYAGRPVEVSRITSVPTSKEELLQHYYIITPWSSDEMFPAASKRSLEPVVEEVNRYKSLLEVSPDVIMEFDTSFRHVYVNQKVEEQTGIPASEFIGKTHQELGFSEDLLLIFDNALEKVFDTGESVRVTFKSPTGFDIDWLLVPQLDKDGKVKTVVSTARDITSLKKAEEALQESQAKLLKAIEIAKLAFWTYDIKKDLLYLEENFANLIGESWDGPKILTLEEYIKTYIHVADQQMVINTFLKAKAMGFSVLRDALEYRLQRKDGFVINAFNIILLTEGEKGEVPKCVGITQDISLLRETQEKLQEYHANLQVLIAQRTEELRRSEEKLSDALKLAKLSTWEFNFQTKMFHGGGQMAEILNPSKSGEYFSSMDVFTYENMIHPDDLPIYHESFQKALRANSEDYLDYIEYRIVRPDGEMRHLYLSIKIEIGNNGKHTRHYGTIQDITSFRKAEEEKERLTNIVEVTPDIVAILDPNGNLTYLNQSGRFFYGFLEQDDIKDINFIDIQNEASKDLLKNTGFFNAEKDGIWTGEGELVGINGQNVPVSMSIVAHYGQEGGLHSYSTIIRNIAAQKKTEQDLKYKNTELDTFVYRASHDLRGPISSLLGLYQIVQYEIKDPKSLEFFDMFNRQILRLNEIILALINLTKIKESTAIQAPINFTSIVNDAIDSFKHLDEFSRVKIKVKINVKLEFRSDKGLITTIIQNLIENAIKYSKKSDSSFVNINIHSTSHRVVVIKVEDNGIGISKDIHYRIFDMFFRGNEISRGSGLGLYILKNAVEKIHGKIHLESELNVGTTFTIELPVLD